MPGSKRRLLIAEDDRSVCDLIRAYLQMAGHEVMIARDGAEALEKARSVRPDAMVLDINLPQIDGFTVLERLAATPSLRPPVLVLTARHAAADVRRAVSLGARDFLAKPFTEAQLVARVTRLLRTPAEADAARTVAL
jgi:DNA-binding response OmpR family regulator